MRRVFQIAQFGVLLAVTGCGLSEFGGSAPYDPRNSTPLDITVPQDAYSISQQFRPRAGATSEAERSPSHLGIDVVAPFGTPVIAAASGRVTRSFFGPAYGHQVFIDHGADAAGRQSWTHYVHLQERMANEGETVRQGDVIGTLGSTGFLAFGPHLHFEVWQRDPDGMKEPRDPNLYWRDGVGQITCFDGNVAPVSGALSLKYPVVCRGDARRR